MFGVFYVKMVVDVNDFVSLSIIIFFFNDNVYERKTSFRPRESRDLGNWGLSQGYAKSLDNDGIIKFRR